MGLLEVFGIRGNSLPNPCNGGTNETGGLSYDWIIGVGIYMFGSVIINLGTNLMKLSHMKNDKKIKSRQRPAYRQGFWWIGMVAPINAVLVIN